MAAPLVIVTALATLYARFASVPEVNAALSGAAAAAAGLVMGTALKMVRNVKPVRLALVATILAFAAVGLAGLPLIPVVVVLAPLSVAAAALERRR
jgi:chromate transporter